MGHNTHQSKIFYGTVIIVSRLNLKKMYNSNFEVECKIWKISKYILYMCTSGCLKNNIIKSYMKIFKKEVRKIFPNLFLLNTFDIS